MAKHLNTIIFAIILSVGTLSTAKGFAGELDDETQVTNQELQGTVIIRMDSRDHSKSIIHTNTVFASDFEAQSAAVHSDFMPLDSTHEKTELDNDGGASSWYFYYPQGRYPNYYYNSYFNWYGRYYQPCYYYNYGYYSYYYYTPRYWGW